ncbi:MAG: hypothetical protein Q9227_007620 [Pyrenula ochraceoflavens]
MSPSSGPSFHHTVDVLVLGAGNAGLSAATAARTSPSKPSVLVCEKAPHSLAGGNTFYTAASFRTCFPGLDALLPYLYNPDGSKGLASELVEKIDMVAYTEEDFMNDIQRVTKGRADKALAETLVKKSWEAVRWLMEQGCKFQLAFNRQAYDIGGRFKFWGGMVLQGVGQGKELFRWHTENAEKHGVDIWWATPVTRLITDEETGKVLGAEVIHEKKKKRIKANGGVIMACGGFEANPAMRVQYLGPGWDLAHVRGSQHNTGDGHRMASAVGAQMTGNFSGCHSVAWDANSPTQMGDRVLTNQYTKSGYPLGVMLNANGHRFVDEGFDMRNFTYAVFGREILKQPAGIAFQVWDAEGAKWLRKEEYADDVTKNIRASTLEELADILTTKGLKDKAQFLQTIEEYNEAVEAFAAEHSDQKFDPAVKDGVSTQSSSKSLQLAKSNWAIPIRKGPFQCVEVTCGITFTFGGLAVHPETAGVISDATGDCIEGLYCTGELLGGLFWDNYPGGSGLTMGTVMGRIAGSRAAAAAARYGSES